MGGTRQSFDDRGLGQAVHDLRMNPVLWTMVEVKDDPEKIRVGLGLLCIPSSRSAHAVVLEEIG
jgi:hypothetical protein